MQDKDTIYKITRMAIQNDPNVSNPTSIMPSVRRKGPIFRRRTVVQLDGTVGSAGEVDRVEKLISRELPDVSIENNLVPRPNTEA
ncbi:MAG: hypothetical protein ACOC2Y_05660 [Spirochaetota bacterium]